MPFTLKANPQFVEPLLVNILHLVEAYWADAADALYPGDSDSYPVFEMIEFSRHDEVQYPFLAIMPRRSSVPEGADGALIDGEHSILLELVVKHPNSKQAVTRGMRYARILHCLLASVTIAEMAEGISTDARAGVFWEVTDQEFLPIRRLYTAPDANVETPSGDPVHGSESDDRPYVQIVQLALTVKLWERFYGVS